MAGDLHPHIVDALVPLASPIEGLVHLKDNPNIGDVDAVARSMREFKQRDPITARVSTKEVTAGNTRLAAAKKLGWTEIAVIWLDDDDAVAKAWALASNQTADLGTMDTALLAKMAQEVRDADARLLAAASFTDKDIDDLLRASEPAPDDTLPEVETAARPATITLNERFMVGPFSVLNSREKRWQERKKAWVDLGIQSELGRDGKPLTWYLASPSGHSHGATPLVPEANDRTEDDPDVEDEGSDLLYGDGSTSIFDPVLCEAVYRWFCPPGGHVLDPFAGGSVRGVVAGMLARQYTGIDVRQIQVDANIAQGEQIVAGNDAIVPEIPDDFMPDLTPVEQRGDLWFKREDLYAFAGVRGAKVRTCMLLIQRAKDAKVGVVTAGARQSPQVNFVAQIAARMDVPCRVHVPSGAMTPELLAARSTGAEVIQHEAGYNTVIIARARDDAAERCWVEIPYGMESEEAVEFTRPQVANIPSGTRRIVNAVGSGMTLAGILWGLLDQPDPSVGVDIPVLGVCVSKPPIERLDRHAPPGWRDMVELVQADTEYHVPAEICWTNGIQLDPYYEAKCIPELQPGDLLWVSAIRPSVVAARAIEPKWICADALEWCSTALKDGMEPFADLIFECPPYGNLEVYSDDPTDLSTMPWDAFRSCYRQIINNSCELLKDDRFAVIVVGDYRDADGLYHNLVGETITAFLDAGLSLYNEAVLVTNLASLVLRVGRQFDASRKLGQTHQSVLVFVKGNPWRATAACGPIVSIDLLEESNDD